MFTLATLMTAEVEVTHLVRIATPEHFGHQAIIVRRLIRRMGVLKRGPVIGKDLLEDTPVSGDVCHHRVAPSEGDQVVWVKRFYHDSSASSTPHRLSSGDPHPAHLALNHGHFWDQKNELSYTIKIAPFGRTLDSSRQSLHRELRLQ